VQYKHLTYPYLYDGETQQVTRAYGSQAAPHVFLFDQQRHLRYEGRMDNSYRTELVKTQDARNAIEALLAHKEVAVKHTGVFGCSTKPKWDSAVPYTILLSADGKVLYKQLGSADLLELKRTILANLPSDYKGFNQYWKNN
jgi:hypothetical protein